MEVWIYLDLLFLIFVKATWSSSIKKEKEKKKKRIEKGRKEEDNKTFQRHTYLRKYVIQVDIFISSILIISSEMYFCL